MKLNNEDVGKIFTRLENSVKLDKILENGQLEFSTPYGDKIVILNDGRFVELKIDMNDLKEVYNG